MLNHFTSLKHSKLQHGVVLKPDADGAGVSKHSPATEVMTDLQHAAAYTISPAASIVEAEKKMILCAVRLLFVTNADNELVGLITSTDILGERPLNYLREHSGRRDAIMVQEIMTDKEGIEVISYPEVVRASIGDIVTTFHAVGRQHVLVVERDTVRGLFSATEISRRLGESLVLDIRARTFAELEAALVAH
ncbi:MAG: CBS domain-containing protein [Gammaproteobacteria bacterium]|nr:CBS domain-containing protein [Gammaproteobacteria bacterium]